MPTSMLLPDVESILIVLSMKTLENFAIWLNKISTPLSTTDISPVITLLFMKFTIVVL